MNHHRLSVQEEYISKEQFCKECHIKKATALYLIQNALFQQSTRNGRQIAI